MSYEERRRRGQQTVERRESQAGMLRKEGPKKIESAFWHGMMLAVVIPGML